MLCRGLKNLFGQAKIQAGYRPNLFQVANHLVDK